MILIFGHFRFAPSKWLLYVAITTVDWGKPFKAALSTFRCLHLLPYGSEPIKYHWEISKWRNSLYNYTLLDL